jgi:P27 family predicted phage terminase small subunit
MALRPPRGLDSTGRAAWRNAAFTLEAIGEDPALSHGALDRYARAVSMVASLRREWVRDGSHGVRIGPRGGISVHPLLRAIERAERAAHQIGETLGLTPMARSRLGRRVGRPAGASSAPDRQTVVPLRRTPRSSA